MRYAPEELICPADQVASYMMESRGTSPMCSALRPGDSGRARKQGGVNFDVIEKRVFAGAAARGVQAVELGSLVWKPVATEQQ